jgi:hypothetical protein
MKRLLSTLLIVILATSASFAKKVVDTKAKIDIDVSEITHDFGNIQAPNAVKHEFTLKNEGSAALVIVSASASCGCTSPKFSPKPIQPGETGKVEVTFTPRGRSGEINEEVKLRLQSANSSKSKRVGLKLTGVVIPAK